MEKFQAAEQNCCRGHAIGIVIAIDDDFLAVGDGMVQDFGCLGCPWKFGRVAQAIEFRFEKVPGNLWVFNSAAEKQLSYDGGNLGGLFKRGDTLRIVRGNAPAFWHEKKDGPSNTRAAV